MQNVHRVALAVALGASVSGCALLQPEAPAPEIRVVTVAKTIKPVVPGECLRDNPPKSTLQGNTSAEVLAYIEREDRAQGQLRKLRSVCRAGLTAQK